MKPDLTMHELSSNVVAESAPPVPTALAELQAWPHWVVWRVENRDGKPSKVPYQATIPSRRASSTDPETWATYEQARNTLERGRCDGVGYVFAPDDEYCGIDLDKCVEPPSGAFAEAVGPDVHTDARSIVTTLDSYTELSPTGTGLHVIVRGRVNGSRNRTGKTPWGGEFEFYDHARFFTITGRHLAWTPRTIEARQEQLDAIRAQLFPATTDSKFPSNGRTPQATVDDDAVIDKIRASKQGNRFAELFDRGAGTTDASSADLALCNILAFWFGPSETAIDRVFRRSALMRDKWDDKRADTTYGGYTIARALEGRREFFGSRTRQHTPARIETEAQFRSAADELAAMCALIDDPFVECWRSGHGTDHRYVLRTRSDRTLDLDPLKSYTTAPKMNAEIAVQLSTEPEIKAGANITRFLRLLGQVCELREEMTTDDRVRNLMTSFVQEASVQPADMEDQVRRAQVFRMLRQKDVVSEAKTEGVSISAKAVVIVDEKTGVRYVKQAWFHAYLRAHLGPSAAEHAGNRLKLHGWEWRGKDGRWKATPDDGGKPLIETFYDVPADWE